MKLGEMKVVGVIEGRKGVATHYTHEESNS